MTRSERWFAVAMALAPVALAAVILTPLAIVGDAGPGDVVVAAVVYGGLAGLATGVVAVDRLQARQCPRCGTRRRRGDAVCANCGYDLVARPRYVCSERHEAYVEPGLCDCGRRLQRWTAPQGAVPQLRVGLFFGVGLLGFLVAVMLLLRVLE